MIDANTFNPAISLDRVTVKYHHTYKSAIKNITADIPRHTITAIIGPNGSGKSTLIKAIVGLVGYSGSIKILSLGNQAQIGYVPQRHHINTKIPITVEELLKVSHPLQSKPLTKNKIHQVLKRVGASDFLKNPLSELSGGQLQRVLLARGMIADPEILILDEPEAGIDSQGEINFYELLKTMKDIQGLTILLASHEIDMVEHYADYVICLNKQLIAKGEPSKVLDKGTLHAVLHHHHASY